MKTGDGWAPLHLPTSPPRGGDSFHLEGNDLEAGRIVLDAICEVSPRTQPIIGVQHVTLAQAGCVLCCRTGRQSGAAPGELRKTKLFTLPGSQSGRPHGQPPGWSGGRRARGGAEDPAFIGVSAQRAGPRGQLRTARCGSFQWPQSYRRGLRLPGTQPWADEVRGIVPMLV